MVHVLSQLDPMVWFMMVVVAIAFVVAAVVLVELLPGDGRSRRARGAQNGRRRRWRSRCHPRAAFAPTADDLARRTWPDVTRRRPADDLADDGPTTGRRPRR